MNYYITKCLVTLSAIAFLSSASAAEMPVTIADDGGAYTLANGVITARVSKRSGGLLSLVYNKSEILDHRGRDAGYWSHSASSRDMKQAITIDPAANGGERGEVSVKGISGGKPLGSGPGGGFTADIEIRYCLGRGDSGLYTYCIFDHRKEYPASSLGEARFCAKLNDDLFDWMTVDADRNLKMLTAYDWNHGAVMNMKEARRLNSGIYKGQVEHKYDYSANQFETLAWGWSSTQKHVGFWFVNPTIEYLSGGPTKVELSAHRDCTFGSDLNAPAAPTLLNYWRGSHYGGSACSVAAGEQWTRVIGPFLLYCNIGATADAAWKDALERSQRETRAWPFDWVAGVDYPHKDQRGAVTGQIVLNDSGSPTAKMTNLLVGVTVPPYSTGGGSRRGHGPTTVDWQMDAKHYQFWVRGDAQGRFAIPNIRPGAYVLHAIADGVLGEFTQANVVIAAGGSIDLGRIDWKPARYGRQLWDIGVADRTAREFLHGDHFWKWGLYNEYPKDFPDDVHYVIGKSDFHKDWNYCQCPRADRPAGTTWSIQFDLPNAPRGRATLRLSLAAVSAKRIDVMVNDKPVGTVDGLVDTATIRRDGIRGWWSERDVTFDASLMTAGKNELKLTIPPGNPMSGVEYDYVRLELDENAARQ